MQKKRAQAGPDDPHGGAKSIERWKLASTHPDEQDLADARDFVLRMEHKLVMKERFWAKQASKRKELQANKSND